MRLLTALVRVRCAIQLNKRLLSEVRDDSATPNIRLRVLQDKAGDGVREARREQSVATESITESLPRRGAGVSPTR
jgi:hypothetical protein